MRKCKRATAFLRRQVRIAGRKREAVDVAHGGEDAQFELKVQVAHHLPEHRGLLRVLLAEVRDIRPHDVEQLQAHGRDAAEVIGTVCALGARALRIDPGVEAGRIELFHRRRKQDVDARFPCDVRIACLVARIAVEVVVRAELRGVHEERHDGDVAFRTRCAEQRQVPVVERSHRRDESGPRL